MPPTRTYDSPDLSPHRPTSLSSIPFRFRRKSMSEDELPLLPSPSLSPSLSTSMSTSPPSSPTVLSTSPSRPLTYTSLRFARPPPPSSLPPIMPMATRAPIHAAPLTLSAMIMTSGPPTTSPNPIRKDRMLMPSFPLPQREAVVPHTLLAHLATSTPVILSTLPARRAPSITVRVSPIPPLCRCMYQSTIVCAGRDQT
ncbi:hypothetical protein BD414DRAFT_220582 [Trametes punicea]|nr:hypothetical protein BD414DRAFT_220582 [Trametes punicea]